MQDESDETIESVYDEIKRGCYHLWMIGPDDAVAVTQIIERPARRIAWVQYIAGENMEHVQMYPGFIEQAKKEERPRESRAFEWARQAEVVHESLYKSALDALEGGGEPHEKEYYICKACGFTAEGQAPEKCPLCGMPRNQFLRVD